MESQCEGAKVVGTSLLCLGVGEVGQARVQDSGWTPVQEMLQITVVPVLFLF